MAKYSKGETVEWKWGNGTASAKVESIYTSGEVSITTKGNTVKRTADSNNPVYELDQGDGTKVLKSQSELE